MDNRTVSKGTKKAGFRWWGDWTSLWILGGFAIAYFIYIAITGDEVHSLHWLFGALGGAVGYGVGLFFDMGLPRVRRFVRRGSRGAIVKRDGGRQAKRRR